MLFADLLTLFLDEVDADDDDGCGGGDGGRTLPVALLIVLAAADVNDREDDLFVWEVDDNDGLIVFFGAKLLEVLAAVALKRDERALSLELILKPIAPRWLGIDTDYLIFFCVLSLKFGQQFRLASGITAAHIYEISIQANLINSFRLHSEVSIFPKS